MLAIDEGGVQTLAVAKPAQRNEGNARPGKSDAKYDLRLALFAGLLLGMMLSNGFTTEAEGPGMASQGSGLAAVVARADVSFRGFFVSKGSSEAI
tara:strand:+ start:132 stop:416 length:285 start_codon:yes stop_codon:yes gene_type:complete